MKKQIFYKYVKCLVTGFITGIVNGLFGSGGGTIVVPSMVHFLEIDEHNAHATAILIILPITVLSAIFYLSGSYINLDITFKVVLGGMAGGYAGAKLLKICPENILRKVFALFMIIAAVRMLV